MQVITRAGQIRLWDRFYYFKSILFLTSFYMTSCATNIQTTSCEMKIEFEHLLTTSSDRPEEFALAIATTKIAENEISDALFEFGSERTFWTDKMNFQDATVVIVSSDSEERHYFQRQFASIPRTVTVLKLKKGGEEKSRYTRYHNKCLSGKFIVQEDSLTYHSNDVKIEE